MQLKNIAIAAAIVSTVAIVGCQKKEEATTPASDVAVTAPASEVTVSAPAATSEVVATSEVAVSAS